MKVEVVLAWPRRCATAALQLPEGATVAEAVAAAALDGTEEAVAYAVFGTVATPETRLRDGDRVELLRPLAIDPKEARRRRARKPEA